MANDLTAEMIQKILDISRPEIHEITDSFGVTSQYSTKPLHEVESQPAHLSSIVKVQTLGGFAALIRAGIEGVDVSKFLIHIENETTVTLKAKDTDEYGRREVLIQAQPVPFERHRFGNWHDQENFAIEIASKFSDTPDTAYVLKMASILTNDASTSSEDDGFTQRVNVKAGLRMKEQTTLKPRVDLAPYRTFPEVPQPVSPFVFRARVTGEGTPALMLVEADGGMWKLQAIDAIRAALDAMNLGLPIIA